MQNIKKKRRKRRAKHIGGAKRPSCCKKSDDKLSNKKKKAEGGRDKKNYVYVLDSVVGPRGAIQSSGNLLKEEVEGARETVMRNCTGFR